ncbi:hypothetical protein GCM10027018_20310 [Paenibacillus thermoaerophilus]|jgi:hypothetical protein
METAGCAQTTDCMRIEVRDMGKQQGHGVKNTQTKSSDKKSNASGNNH